MTCVQNANTNGPCPQWAYNTSTNQITTTGCTYDAAGNMTTDCSSAAPYHTYQWDGEGRVASVDNGSTWTFTYNAVGDRVQWASPSETDQHLFDPAGHWVTNAGQFSVVRRGEGTLAVYDGSETHLDHTNNLGSTTMRTDYSGAAARDILFYPWGGVWEAWGADGYNFAELPWRDLTTTTDLTTFRNFSPGLGRWLSPDPVGGDITNPQSLNRYPYVLNNPTTLTDPLGLGSQPMGELYGEFLAACERSTSCMWNYWSTGPWIPGVIPNEDLAGMFYDALNATNGYDIFDAMQGRPTPEQAYEAQVRAAFSGVVATNNTYQVWVPTKFTQNGDVIHMTLGHFEDVVPCYGGDAWCDAQGHVVRSNPNIVSDDAFNAGAAAVVAGLAGLPTMQVAIGPGEPFHVAYGAGGRWLNVLGGNLGKMTVSRAFAQDTASSAWVKLSVPVLNTARVLATEGSAAWTCVTAAISAIAKGWIPW